MFKSYFKTAFSENIFNTKYRQDQNDSWGALSTRLVEDVCGPFQGKALPLLSQEDRDQLVQWHKEFKWVAGGRYLYYAGRPHHYWNNCYIGIAKDDTREEWANLAHWSTSCLMTGGGIGIDYSVFRGKGVPISKTGGVSSGPISLMSMINEIGRNVMQGGSRRSAMYASLNWLHEDIPDFLRIKNWSEQIKQIKETDFNFPVTLDMTNISINYDNKWKYNANRASLHTFVENCRQAMMTGEPKLTIWAFVE